EMGSGFGYSTYWFAQAVGEGGRVVHTDGDAKKSADAKDYLARAGLAARVTFEVGDAVAVLKKYPGPFDVVIIDIDKRGYRPELATRAASPGHDSLQYQAGRFLTVDPHQFESVERFIAFFEDVKGKKEPPRAYSRACAPHERYLAVTVKEERCVSGVTKYPP